MFYGIVKFVLGVLALTLPVPSRENMQDIPVLSDFITMDVTTAGKAIDVAILIFATYAIIKSTLTLYKKSSFIHDKRIVYLLYSILGSFLLLFYLTVINTNIISKDVNETGTYELSGIGSGLCFVMTALIIYVWHHYHVLSTQLIVGLILIAMLCIVGIGYIVYKNIDRITRKRNEIITVVMMPLGAM